MLPWLLKPCAHDHDGYPIIPNTYQTNNSFFRLLDIISFVEEQAEFACKSSIFCLLWCAQASIKEDMRLSEMVASANWPGKCP